MITRHGFLTGPPFAPISPYAQMVKKRAERRRVPEALGRHGRLAWEVGPDGDRLAGVAEPHDPLDDPLNRAQLGQVILGQPKANNDSFRWNSLKILLSDSQEYSKRAWRLFLVDAVLTVGARMLSDATTFTMFLAIARLTACSARVAAWRSPLRTWRLVPFCMGRHSCLCVAAAA